MKCGLRERALNLRMGVQRKERGFEGNKDNRLSKLG
jgi:hypothetical protein